MSSEKKPPGGYDSTPLHPAKAPTYTIKITFHRAYNVPVSDYGGRSADPYILAQINASAPTRHPEDPRVRFRTKTIRKSLEPEWNASWVVAGVPESGMTLEARLFDEDSDDHDDQLGNIEVETGRLDEKWEGIKEEDIKVRKTGANVRAYTLRCCSTMVHPKRQLHARLVISIEMVGRTMEEMGKVYTMNNFWYIHYSPMIGRLAGTKAREGSTEKAE